MVGTHYELWVLIIERKIQGRICVERRQNLGLTFG